MSNQVEISIHKPFGPRIGQGKIPYEIIDQINNFVDEISENQTEMEKLNAGPQLVGEVSQEMKLPPNIINLGLIDYVSKLTKAFILASTGREITEFRLISAWVVRQYQGEYNPSHWHDGHISGAGYIKLPKKFGENIQENKSNNFNGNINFIHGSRQFLSRSIKTAKPEVGDIYVFPNYLMHSVNPFYGEGERRSISFNAFVDENIFNVYGLRN